MIFSFEKRGHRLLVGGNGAEFPAPNLNVHDAVFSFFYIWFPGASQSLYREIAAEKLVSRRFSILQPTEAAVCRCSTKQMFFEKLWRTSFTQKTPGRLLLNRCMTFSHQILRSFYGHIDVRSKKHLPDEKWLLYGICSVWFD